MKKINGDDKEMTAVLLKEYVGRHILKRKVAQGKGREKGREKRNT